MLLPHPSIPSPIENTTNRIENRSCTGRATTHIPQLCARGNALPKAARHVLCEASHTRSADKAHAVHEGGHSPPTHPKHRSQREAAYLKDEGASRHEPVTRKQNTTTKTRNTARQMRQRGWRYNRHITSGGQCRSPPRGVFLKCLKAQKGDKKNPESTRAGHGCCGGFQKSPDHGPARGNVIAMHTDSLRPCGNHARKLTAPKIQALGSKMGAMTHSAHEAMRSPYISMEPASWRYEPQSPILAHRKTLDPFPRRSCAPQKNPGMQ